ncbi:Target of rapamycin complex 2 subunit avo2 [Dermatophagoides pteronyssinus]|uniref:Target of rapamycin complex 2 subunit avo2 n=1 Tax=Dermatophagoides pteronyssinus TaxID=6956 RepID=A0ABQ8JPH2_DERPT|nr:Target of rapamycin complex 2 subunit avo2 [Dermatophagoides pteronyssinus]
MNNNNNGYQSNDKLSKNFNDNDDQDDKKLLKIKTVTAACVGGDNNHYQSSSIKHLIDAAIQNNIEMINTYHQTFNIPVDSIDENGHTALIYASRNGNVNAVRRFIELNANVDYQEPFEFNTALHYAAQCGHTRTAELLINFGNANTKIKNKFGKTPFELAKDFGHGKNISYLPHITLLERFSKFGCYRLMGDGYGFELLARNEYQDFNQEQHTDPQRVNNLYAYNLWRKENLDKILKMIQFIQNGGGFEYQHLENY